MNLQKRPVGYARVSTHGQTLDAQLTQLKAARSAPIFREKVTGAPRPTVTLAGRPMPAEGRGAKAGAIFAVSAA
jgi:hypothetical protein